MKFNLIWGAIFLLFSEAPLLAQSPKKLVVMGSSTAAGNGATTYDSSWAGRTTSYYARNLLDGLDTIVQNISLPGQSSYHQMPTGFVPPQGRPSPDPAHNVTLAVSLHPDIVIINLPTNDVAFYFTKKEFMDNLRAMKNYLNAAGIVCYVTTPQPRADFNAADNTRLRDSLKTLVDSVKNNFGIYAIDFWSDLVTADGTYDFKPEVWYDGIHVNNLGHTYLFNRVRDKQIFGNNDPLPVKLKSFSATLAGMSAALVWQTETEEPNTVFEIQRSAGNDQFSTIHVSNGKASGLTNDYKWTDTQPLNGYNFYRLKIKEPDGAIFYSAVKNIRTAPGQLVLKTISVKDNQLFLEISSPENSPGTVRILNFSGLVLFEQQFRMLKTDEKINILLNNISRGAYVLQIEYVNCGILSRQFQK